ncbi:hypothetical protein Pmani_005896 [Petrolisthes manimaculis]|uniref:Uncharacterized protein n=1 Tax=Petrolisthes manimaculis TaxID=1843537 RepID=A0AAE1UH18_9EUCA|nr:hypothetical protein Pmani_005896 [Petrolisthes manimaculis]
MKTVACVLTVAVAVGLVAVKANPWLYCNDETNINQSNRTLRHLVAMVCTADNNNCFHKVDECANLAILTSENTNNLEGFKLELAALKESLPSCVESLHIPNVTLSKLPETPTSDADIEHVCEVPMNDVWKQVLHNTDPMVYLMKCMMEENGKRHPHNSLMVLKSIPATKPEDNYMGNLSTYRDAFRRTMRKPFRNTTTRRITTYMKTDISE